MIESVNEAEDPRAAFDDLVVLRSAEWEANDRARRASEGMFVDLAAEIVTLAHRFGMSELESVALDRAAHMRVRTGGQETPFGKCTGGERWRLRLATVVALLRVGQQTGRGGHPGLLLVDGLGREELADTDALALLRALNSVCAEVPDLQVVITSADADLVSEVVPWRG